jgi:hypothetical protein
MGFFSKIKKGFKKVVSKIGKGIRKTVKKVGKFMDKIGIVGQIGLALVLPGIGGMLGGLAGTMMQSSVGFIKGAGQFLNAAVNVGTKATSMFKSVTEGVTKVLGDVVGATINKIPGAGDLIKGVTGGRIDITSKTFTEAWKTTQTAVSDVAAKGGDLFSMGTLTDPNKYFVKSTITPAQEALSGTEGPSTFDDSKLDFLDEQPASEFNLEAGTGLPSKEAGQIDLRAAGIEPSAPVSRAPEDWFRPDTVSAGPTPAENLAMPKGTFYEDALATDPVLQGSGTPAENLEMSEGTFYEDAFKTDPALQKGKSLLESGKKIIEMFNPTREQQMQREYEGAGIIDIYNAPDVARNQLPVVYQRFEADPMLAQSYAYGAGAAYNNYKKLFSSIYPGVVA